MQFHVARCSLARVVGKPESRDNIFVAENAAQLFVLSNAILGTSSDCMLFHEPPGVL